MQLLTHPKPIASRANTLERIENLSLQPVESHLPTPASSDHSEEKEEDLRHVFAIGDCAETGAIQAGHTAYWQAEVAARNVCRLIEKQEGRAKDTLESYKPGAPCIKLTLGLVSLSYLVYAICANEVDKGRHCYRRRSCCLRGWRGGSQSFAHVVCLSSVIQKPSDHLGQCLLLATATRKNREHRHNHSRQPHEILPVRTISWTSQNDYRIMRTMPALALHSVHYA